MYLSSRHGLLGRQIPAHEPGEKLDFRPLYFTAGPFTTWQVYLLVLPALEGKLKIGVVGNARKFIVRLVGMVRCLNFLPLTCFQETVPSFKSIWIAY